MVVVSRKDYINTYKSSYYGEKYAKKYSEWFPVNKSPELAALIGDLTTDGHVQGPDKFRFDFTSKSKKKLKSFEKRLENLFGVTGSIRENRNNPYSESYNYGVNCKPLTRVLIESGAPVGCKVKTCFNVPRWIQNDKKCFSAYIERAFANDGSAFSGNPRITYELRKEQSISENLREYMNTINSLLIQYYGISGSVFERSKINEREDGDKTVGIGLNIRERDAIKKFHKNFNITDKHMSEHIRKIVEGPVAQPGRALD